MYKNTYIHNIYMYVCIQIRIMSGIQVDGPKLHKCPRELPWATAAAASLCDQSRRLLLDRAALPATAASLQTVPGFTILHTNMEMGQTPYKTILLHDTCMYIRVHMYICTYAHMYRCTYVYMYICIYVYVNIGIYENKYVCIFVLMYVWLSARVCICVYLYGCMSRCLYEYAHASICLYVYMSICEYVYMSFCICMCICIHVCTCMCPCVCICTCTTYIL